MGPALAYDHAMIGRVQTAWYRALAGRPDRATYAGEVKISFVLYSDGRISDLVVAGEHVPETIAELVREVITQVTPFDSWPNDVRDAIGKDRRSVRFTFHYTGEEPPPTRPRARTLRELRKRIAQPDDAATVSNTNRVYTP